MVKNGVKVLSYFIHGGYHSSNGDSQFERMYGKHTKNVDVTNIVQLTKTLNKFFE